MNTLATLEERRTFYGKVIASIISEVGEIKKTEGIYYWNKDKDFSDPFVYDITDDKIENLDSILDKLENKPRICTGSDNRTYYTVGLNKITTVEKKLFHSIHHYYWALVHEHAHWTGDSDRIQRYMFNVPYFFVSVQDKAIEEIIAEVATRIIFEMTGNMTDEIRTNNQNYIRNMLVHLGDINAVTEIGYSAMEAVEFILTGEAIDIRKVVVSEGESI